MQDDQRGVGIGVPVVIAVSLLLDRNVPNVVVGRIRNAVKKIVLRSPGEQR